jgi:MerR family mercuric resistance operon transcriptional regulator
MTTRNLTIGRLAKESEVGVETVRFYERKGLIQRPRKGDGFRVYRPEDSSRIRFIKRAQDLGFTLREIKQLLELNADPRTNCAEVRRRTDAKIAEVTAKIADLRKMKRSLEALACACAEGKDAVACCQVMDCFDR